jgi:undecaprenyl diphosphate synthase
MKMRVLFGMIGIPFFLIVCTGIIRNDWSGKTEATLKTNIDIPESAAVNESEKQVQHLACIMDGNRRWAKRNGLKPWYGHREGVEAVRKVVQFCMQKKIKYLSLYTFSLENFKRSYEENSYLFSLMVQEAQKGVSEFRKHGIRLRFRGDRSLFPQELCPLLDTVEKETQDLDTLHVTFLFCYGGRQEIANATKNIALDLKDGKLTADAITPELISSYLWTHDLPDPDLIIRTGGFSRLSNFLLYQAAYSEIYVFDCMWPDITTQHLQEAYDSFVQCTRNFGA